MQGTVEKFLFKKISVWIVLLLAILALIIAILFGATVRNYYYRGNTLGKFGIVMAEIATVPSNIKLLSTAQLKAPKQRFESEKGFTFNYAAGTRPDLGYLLLNRYDGDLKMSVSELIDLNTQEQIHQWRFDVDPLWDISNLESNYTDLKSDHPTKRLRNMHAFLLETGDLLASGEYAPLLKNNLSSQLKIFKDDDIYNHAIEMDADGNFWVSKVIEPNSVKLGTHRFKDDAICLLNPDGIIIFEKSIIEILIENGMEVLAYSGEEGYDPIHVNDVQPILIDGPFWKKGDVFISLRNKSMLILYRPSTNEVLWYRQGPWLHQHDVDIVDNHTIAIFNNRSYSNHIINGRKGTNQIIIYDFQTKRITKPFTTAFEKQKIQTPYEGLFNLISDNEIFVEETYSGRLIQFDKNGTTIWQYINRASDGMVYYTNWSRLISRELGDKVRQKTKEVKM